MNDLVPCPACSRHVRKYETACPFCSAELALGDLPPPVLPRARLGRAATFAFGATLAGATLVACGGESEDGKKGGGGESAGGTTSQAGSSTGGTTTAGNNAMGGNIAQPYGVPPIGGAGFGNVGGSGGATSAGAGGQTSAGAGGQTDAGSGNGGTGIAPPYGIPPAGFGPVYGAAPAG